jgi:hypothetical protein
MKAFLKVICAFLAVGFVSCETPEPNIEPNTTIASLGTPADNEIWFTINDERELMSLNAEAFDAEIVSIEYSEYDVSVITFADKITTVGANAFNNCRNLSNISLPESVTTIGERAFFECHNLECITLGTKIKSCGYQAFDNCISLYSLHLSSIGDWCQIEFADPTANPIYHSGSITINNKRVKNLTIPAWIKKIGAYAFYNYTTLESIKISKTIEYIGEDAFSGCDVLTKVDVEDIGAWCSIEFASAFSNPLSITGSLYIDGEPATVLSLKGIETIAPRAFQGCNNIKALVADNALKEIGEEAFRGCAGLISVELQSGITTIGGRAFMGCSSLEHVVVMTPAPPALGDKYVFDYNAEGRKIYIPFGAYDIYAKDSMWSKYADSLEER